MPKNLWNSEVNGNLKAGLEELVYRSNLLGSDRSVANWGGGNTSFKTTTTDFRGRKRELMWVKGSGSDLATMKDKNFTALYLDDIAPLIEREEMSDEEMVAYLSHCMVESAHPRSSIETLLHAFLPFNHIDHTHPDAIISLCCTNNGRMIAEQIYGNRYVWVPYVRPGFTLSKMIAEGVRKNPQAELVLMEKHGLVTWGDTSEECYHRTLSVIAEAEDFLKEAEKGKSLFGGAKVESLKATERQAILATILPIIRGQVSDKRRMIVTYDDSVELLNFVNSVEANELSQVGAACPDHLVHTKRVPLFVDWNPQEEDLDTLTDRLKEGIASYKEEYRNYFERNRNDCDQIAEAAPRVILIPGLGMVNTGKSRAMAQVSGNLFQRAVSVIKGSTVIGDFVSLNEAESYAVEYWPLELYKLSLAPAEGEFSRKIAFVTGGAGGIGSTTCLRLAEEGAHVVVADLNVEGAGRIAQEINQLYGEGRAIAVKMDVTKEQEITMAMREAILSFGGIDILVNNAGLATSSPFDETSLKEWELNMNVLGTGYFLVAREGFKLMKKQGLGGSMVFVGSKNSIYAGKNATAYSTAKAAEVHLARCISTEGGEYGIRVNCVLPDAVLQGSAIWNSSWRNERAAAYGIEPDQLESYYRDRTTLKVNVLPIDIAEAIAYFSSSRASKTTGCMITVDGGVPAAFTR